MRILVTGGCGYKGSVLIPKLLARGHRVDVIDPCWFGNFLKPHPALNIIKDNIDCIRGLLAVDAIIHLAGVANDPCANLDKALTWEVGAGATERLAAAAVAAGVKQFIFASSASVYGISDAPRVTEDLPLNPVTVYSQAKAVAERVLLSYADRMSVQIVRPATVCGISPRMRLDVAVNLLTMQALNRGRITVLGGAQQRPNIHIDDITDLYCFMLDNPHLTGVYNAGFENLSVMQIAEHIAERTHAELVIEPSNDPRSYRLDSSKLLATGFKPKKTVADAVNEIVHAHNIGELIEDDRMSNVGWMRQQGIVRAE